MPTTHASEAAFAWGIYYETTNSVSHFAWRKLHEMPLKVGRNTATQTHASMENLRAQATHQTQTTCKSELLFFVLSSFLSISESQVVLSQYNHVK